jgi:hypothetical protein
VLTRVNTTQKGKAQLRLGSFNSSLSLLQRHQKQGPAKECLRKITLYILLRSFTLNLQVRLLLFIPLRRLSQSSLLKHFSSICKTQAPSPTHIESNWGDCAYSYFLFGSSKYFCKTSSPELRSLV